MNIEVPRIDGRTVHAGGTIPIKDLDSGDTVGYLETGQGFEAGTMRQPSRSICLFGKYYGSFESHNECVAFAKGVQAVLKHMVAMEPRLPVAPR